MYEDDKQYCESISVLCGNGCYKEAAAKAKAFENSGIGLPNHMSSNEIAEKYIKRYWSPKQKSQEETMTFYRLLEYITDKRSRILCCKHARRFSYPFQAHFESHEYSKFYRLALAQGPSDFVDDSLSTSLTFYDIALHLSTICEHFKIHEALVINSARSCYSKCNSSIDPKILFELENISHSSTDVENKLNAHLLLARHDKSCIPKAMEVCSHYHCLPMEIELSLMELQNCTHREKQIFIQLAKIVQYLHTLDESKLLTGYEQMLCIYKGKSDEGYYHQQQYISEYLNIKFTSDCYLLPHKSQDIWVQMLTEDTDADADGMHIIVSHSNLFNKIKQYLKINILDQMMARFGGVESLLQFYYCDFRSRNRFKPEEISCSLQCCQLMLLEYDSQEHHSYYEAATLLRQYHSLEWSYYFPVCTSFVQWIDSKNQGFLYLQSHIKMWLKKYAARQTCFDFLKFWEQASIAKLMQSLRKLNLSSTDQPSDYLGALECYKMATKWINVCNQVINNPVKSCSMFFENCLPELIHLDYNIRSIVDSISVHGTILLALLSCVSDSSSPPIIIPHMHYRALRVYDSLLPKPHDDLEQNILDSCSLQCDHLIESSPSGKLQLLQYLFSALEKIEVLFKEHCLLLCQHSDLPRLTVILMLTLYMNYAVHVTPSYSSTFHSRCTECLRKLEESIILQNFNIFTVCNAFQEARHPLHLLRILKYLLCPNTERERYESLAIVVFSKEHKKITIESIDDDDMRLPAELQTRNLPDEHLMPVSQLVSKDKRLKYLYFSLPYEYDYPLRTVPLEPVWTLYKECAEEVHERVREFVHLVISKDSEFASTIRDKSFFQQYLHCLSHIKLAEESSD